MSTSILLILAGGIWTNLTILQVIAIENCDIALTASTLAKFIASFVDDEKDNDLLEVCHSNRPGLVRGYHDNTGNLETKNQPSRCPCSG